MKGKPLLCILMCLAFVAGLSIQAVAAPLRETVSAILQPSTLLVNGELHTAQSLNYQDTTYVSLRKIAELLGCKVHWDSKTRTITIKGLPSFTDPEIIEPSKSNLGVFPGYFKNVDYSNPEVFLMNGEQTKANDEIRAIAAQFNNNNDLSTIQEIFQWLDKNVHYGPGDKFGRTSAQIIGSRIATGCTDYGLAFATLAREKGIPTVFVQTARIDWIQDLVSNRQEAIHIRGHILVEVFIKDQWYLVDSTAGKLFLDYDKDNLSLCDGYYTFAKSIEVWDSGVLNEQENRVAMFSAFHGFDPSRYQNPKYDYIDLRTGERRASGDFVAETPSQPVEFRAAILGAQAPVEKFGPKFNLASRDVMRAGYHVPEERIQGLETLVLLTFAGEPLPDYLLKAVPRLDDPGEFYCSYVDDGKRIVVVKAASEEKLMQMIDVLPGDILDNDY